MKKLLVFILALACGLGLIGCGNQPKQAENGKLLQDGNVANIAVASLPEGYAHSFGKDDAKAIVDYLSNLNLDDKFKENPSEYAGMTWVITLEYDNGDVLTIYHFGNMFIKAENSPWYRMNYEEAIRFDSLLNELNH